MAINTVVFTCSDGKVSKMPLDYLVEHGAMIVDTVNGEPIEETIGSRNQLWISSSSGRYFLKDVESIDFREEEEPPEPPDFAQTDRSYTNRPNVAIVCRKYQYLLGEQITFEGWASDYDKRIVAVEFSMDGGDTWTQYDTSGATADRWVYWTFQYEPPMTGEYQLKARAVNEDGKRSPLAAVHSFSVW